MTPEVTVVMLAYGAELHLADAVSAVLRSKDVALELLLVDNGASPQAMVALPHDERLTVLTPGTNLGFTGGVNLATRSASADVLVLVNSDAVVLDDCIATLCRRLDDRSVAVAGALVLLADDPATVNSAGNPLHVLGLSWAGSMGRPAATIPLDRQVTSASGACLAIRTEVWRALGGFPEPYFAYLEDLELSWRCWQRGLTVVVVAGAVAMHHYEFSRSPLKMYLLERNRLLLLATCHQRRTLALLLPVLLVFEAAITVVAALQGWGGQKVRGWVWILRNLRWVRARRAAVQAARTVPDRALLHLLTDRFEPAQTPLPPAAAPLEGLLRLYWAAVRKAI